MTGFAGAVESNVTVGVDVPVIVALLEYGPNAAVLAPRVRTRHRYGVVLFGSVPAGIVYEDVALVMSDVSATQVVPLLIEYWIVKADCFALSVPGLCFHVSVTALKDRSTAVPLGARELGASGGTTVVTVSLVLYALLRLPVLETALTR
jgi:hypothetical protein